MLHDFTYLESLSPNPTCRHMDRCSLSLFVGGSAACEFSQSGRQNSEPINLSAAEWFEPAVRSSQLSRQPRPILRNQ